MTSVGPGGFRRSRMAYREFVEEDRDTDAVGLLISDLLGGGERCPLQVPPPRLRGTRHLDAAPVLVQATRRRVPQLRSDILAYAARGHRGVVLARIGWCPEVSAPTTIDVVLPTATRPRPVWDLSLYVAPEGEVAFLTASGAGSLLWRNGRFASIDLGVLTHEERCDGERLGGRLVRRATSR